MSTFFLDFVGGNDANDGTSFANRWLTFASGATAARTAPGDTIRVMASPDPTLIGNATWTQDSTTITLASSVTQMITDCETAWTASANVTATTSTTRKENAKSASIAIASGFTTGLAAFFATGTLDLSGYQQVSFWIQNSIAVADGATLSLRLCSDAAGVTTVNTIAIPALPGTGRFTMITVDTSAALGSSIASIALYCDKDPGTLTVLLDNIIACKASSSADALTLTSLIGKKWNQVWAASTTYAQNDIVKPTQPNRNGFVYKNTTAGSNSSGGSEPTWPTEVGVSVVDSGVTWQCLQLEDTWYPIQSINGVTVKIDCDVTQQPTSAGGTYTGATESVATYKRECITIPMVASSATIYQSVQEGGTDGSHITYSGGWNRTDMSTQTGETWVQALNGRSVAFSNTRTFITLRNLNVGRASTSFSITNTYLCALENCHGRFLGSTTTALRITGACFGNDFSSTSGGIDLTGGKEGSILKRVSVNGNNGEGIVSDFRFLGDYCYCAGNSRSGILVSGPDATLTNCVTRANATIGLDASSWGVRAFNCLTPDGMASPAARNGCYVYSQRDQQVANAHKIITDAASSASLITSDSSTRHTASGIAWKFHTDGGSVHMSEYPQHLSVAKLAVLANVLVTISLWTRRDSTNIFGKLHVRGGQVAGVPNDVDSAAQAPTINTWVLSDAITFTPTENGVIEFEFLAYSDDGMQHSFWIDDLVVA